MSNERSSRHHGEQVQSRVCSKDHVHGKKCCKKHASNPVHSICGILAQVFIGAMIPLLSI